MSTDSQNAFPADMRDYYYRYRISEIEKIKAEYNSIYDFITAKRNEIFPTTTNSSNNQELDDELLEFLNRLEKLKDDFNYYAENIIEKRNITSNEDFTHDMENLMLIAGETILHCEEGIILSKNVDCRQKFEYDGSKLKLKDIVRKFKKIPYELDRDAPLNVVLERYQSVILQIVLFLLIFGELFILLIVVLPVASYVNSVYYWLPFENNNFTFLITLEVIISTLYFCFKIINSIGYRMTETRSDVYSKTKDITYKPFDKKQKRRFNNLVKAVKVIISFIHRK